MGGFEVHRAHVPVGRVPARLVEESMDVGRDLPARFLLVGPGLVELPDELLRVIVVIHELLAAQAGVRPGPDNFQELVYRRTPAPRRRKNLVPSPCSAKRPPRGPVGVRREVLEVR